MGLHSCQLPGLLIFNGSDKTKCVKKNGKKMPKHNFLNPYFGALPKIRDWIQKYVQIRHGFQFSKMVLRSILA